MIIIPAIDLMKGKCVRLVRGDPKKMKIYYEDPLVPARMFMEQGAKLIHIVDLDAAMGYGSNAETISKIIKSFPIDMQVGGGIRSLEKAGEMLNIGARRVIFGTAAVRNPDLVRKAVSRFGGDKVAVAIDIRNDEVMVEGWTVKSGLNYIEFAKTLEHVGVGAIILTSTTLDGTLSGPALDPIKRLVESIDTPVIASGGIGSLRDLDKLSKTGVSGVIVGKALYEGKFSLKEAIKTYGGGSFES